MLRKDRKAVFLMAVVVLSNPLFEKFRNITIDDSVEQIQAVDANSTELGNVLPKVEITRSTTATPTADTLIDGRTSPNVRKIQPKSQSCKKHESNCTTRGGQITRSSIRNQQSTLKTPTTYHSNDDLASAHVDQTGIQITSNTNEKDQKSIPPGDVATFPASGPTSKTVMPKVRPSSSSSGVKSITPVGGLNQKSPTGTHTPPSKSKEDTGVKSFEEVLQQSSSGEKRQTSRSTATTKVCKSGGARPAERRTREKERLQLWTWAFCKFACIGADRKNCEGKG